MEKRSAAGADDGSSKRARFDSGRISTATSDTVRSWIETNVGPSPQDSEGSEDWKLKTEAQDRILSNLRLLQSQARERKVIPWVGAGISMGLFTGARAVLLNGIAYRLHTCLHTVQDGKIHFPMRTCSLKDAKGRSAMCQTVIIETPRKTRPANTVYAWTHAHLVFMCMHTCMHMHHCHRCGHRHHLVVVIVMITSSWPSRSLSLNMLTR